MPPPLPLRRLPQRQHLQQGQPAISIIIIIMMRAARAAPRLATTYMCTCRFALRLQPCEGRWSSPPLLLPQRHLPLLGAVQRLPPRRAPAVQRLRAQRASTPAQVEVQEQA